MHIETKFIPMAEPLTVEAGDRIEGYASLFGRRDQSGDIVEPGAYTRSLARLKERGGRVRMLWQHDPAQPLGVWDEVREDNRGLWASGRLLPEVTRAREARALIESGAIDGLSIGYRVLKSADGPGKTRRLIEIELWEVSLVTFPMLPEARIGAKSDAPDQDWHGLARAFDAARAQIARGPLPRKGDHP